jgi:hypothetical protein
LVSLVEQFDTVAPTPPRPRFRPFTAGVAPVAIVPVPGVARSIPSLDVVAVAVAVAVITPNVHEASSAACVGASEVKRTTPTGRTVL